MPYFLLGFFAAASFDAYGLAICILSILFNGFTVDVIDIVVGWSYFYLIRCQKMKITGLADFVLPVAALILKWPLIMGLSALMTGNRNVVLALVFHFVLHTFLSHVYGTPIFLVIVYLSCKRVGTK